MKLSITIFIAELLIEFNITNAKDIQILYQNTSTIFSLLLIYFLFILF